MTEQMIKLKETLTNAGYSPKFVEFWHNQTYGNGSVERQSEAMYMLGEIVAKDVIEGNQKARIALEGISKRGFEKGRLYQFAQGLLDQETIDVQDKRRTA